MTETAIAEHGLIGDLQTAALVTTDGSIDWLCLPHFDSPSVFAAILDDRKGGRFVIAPIGEGVRHKQFYWPDTAILVTRFLHERGVAEITDFMPVGGAGDATIQSRSVCPSRSSSSGWPRSWTR